MAESEQELLDALQTALQSPGEKPCGCRDKIEAESGYFDLTGSGQAPTLAALEAEVDSALATLEASAALGPESLDQKSISIEEQLEFADIELESRVGLEDILALAEKYPGLKITFSF